MAKRKVDLSTRTLGAEAVDGMKFRSKTADEKARTVDIVWTTGAAVKRYGYMPDGSGYGGYTEELSVLDGAVDVESRLNIGAPVLNCHSRYDLSDVIGVVVEGSARIEKGKGLATIKFSEREDVEPYFRDVVAGIIRNVSVGYSVQRYEVIREEGVDPIFRAVAWTPSEVSLVPIGADPSAGVRSADILTPCEIIEIGDIGMKTKGKPPAVEAVRSAEAQQGAEHAPVPQTVAPVVDADAIRKEAMAAAGALATEIRSVVTLAGLGGDVADGMISRAITVDQSRAEVLNILAESKAANNIRAVHTQGDSGDNPEVMSKRMAEALAVRFNGQAPSDESRQYVGLTVAGMACELMAARGLGDLRFERNKSSIIERAMETSDFPLLLQSAGSRIMMPSYEAAPSTYQSIAKKMTATDFRTRKLIRDGDFPEMQEVQENGEFKHGSMSESEESIALKTVGASLVLTRQALINDDLGAFANMGLKAGASARRYENKTVWALVSGNKVMSDGKTLYHADHLNQSGAAGTISATTIGAGKKAIRLQKNADGNPLNYQPSIIAVPAALETIVEQYLAQVIIPTKASDVIPASHKQLTPIIEPLLDAVSEANWHLFVNPEQLATIVYSYLEGQEGPQLVEGDMSKALGMKWDVYLDFDAVPVDFRGTYRNS